MNTAIYKAVLLVFALTLSITANAIADSPKPVDVPAGDLTVALELLQKQSGAEIVYRPELLKGIRTGGVKGTFSSQEAVTMLLKGTMLKLHSDRSGVLLITTSRTGGAAIFAPRNAERDSGGTSVDLPTPAADRSGQTAVAQVATSAAASESDRLTRLEEITVTARKRSESLQDVPVAETAISREYLENNLANDLNKIGELAPQVMIGRATSGTGAIFTIRGISSAAVDSGLDQSVSMSIDGVALSRGRIIESAMFDLQQVEILEGPQALFFGKNSPAGVISIESTDPTDHLEGYGKGGYEFVAKEKYVETAVSVPIADTLDARVAFRGSWMDGWIRNNAVALPNPFEPEAPVPGAVQGDTQPAGHELDGRLTLLWKPTDDFSAKFKLTISSQRLNTDDAYSEPFCVNKNDVPRQFGLVLPNSDCAANMVEAESALPAVFAINYPLANGGVPYLRSDLGLASLTLNKTLGDISLTSTTGYYDQEHRGSFTGDYGPYAQIYDAEEERYRLVNEEFRINTEFSMPVNFMTGGYFEHSSRHFLNVPDLFNTFNPVAQSYVTTIAASENASDSYSGFGQLRWKIVPTLELAGGARYTHDVKTSTLQNTYNNPLQVAAFGLLPQGQILTPRYSGDNVSPDVTLTWKPEGNQTLYTAYKTGYKAGGISNPALLPASDTSTNVLFGPEKVKGSEVGYKADFFANTLRLDFAAYRYDYNGLQVTAVEPVTLIYTIRNAAEARTTGFAGSFEWLATGRLSFDGNIGYNHARYLSFPNAQCYGGQTVEQGCVVVNGAAVQDLSGKALDRAPAVTFKLGSDYRANLIQGWVADLSASAAYTSSYQSAADYNAGGPQSPYWIVNAALQISPQSEDYKISLIGRNLADSYYKIATTTWNTTQGYFATFNRPREVALQFSYKF